MINQKSYNNPLNIFANMSLTTLSITSICVLCLYSCFRKSSNKKINSIDSRGFNYKLNITKYDYNEDPDILEYSKYKKEIIKKNNYNNKTEKKNYFIFKFDNLSKTTKEYYKISKNSDEFDNLIKFINFILRVGDNSKDEIIIIISSPGGYAFEFEEAYTQLSRLTQNGFDTIALIDKICASGGYMLACACDKIICSETSMIGSIGVIGQTLNYKELADKIGIKFFRFTTGKYKGGFPTSTSYDESDIELTKEEINKTLEIFKKIVSFSRKNIDIDQVLSAKVWYGKEALEIGLVDKLQVLDDFIFELEKDNHNIYYVNPEIRKEGFLDNLGSMIDFGQNNYVGLLKNLKNDNFLNITM